MCYYGGMDTAVGIAQYAELKKRAEKFGNIVELVYMKNGEHMLMDYKTENGKNAIREIHYTVYEQHKFNDNGILREKDNYILYENKNWTENVAYPVVEYEKIELPLPPPPPKPKPKPKKILEKSVEVFREEITARHNYYRVQNQIEI